MVNVPRWHLKNGIEWSKSIAWKIEFFSIKHNDLLEELQILQVGITNSTPTMCDFLEEEEKTHVEKP